MNCRYLLVLLLFCPLSLLSQEYSYMHYDNKVGMASSTVYCMTQDKEGFLWFGTEAGLSRFDGTHFKTFTQEDGLPDNEVIQLFSDSKGRVWISPFKKMICYYYKGQIHNSTNDTLLQKLLTRDIVVHFAEDKEGNVLLQETGRLHLIKANGEVTTISTINDNPWNYITHIGSRKAGGFWVVQDSSVYAFNNDRFSLVRKINHIYDHLHFNNCAINYDRLLWRGTSKEIDIVTLGERKNVRTIPMQKHEYHNCVVLDSRFVASCTLEGAMVYDLNFSDSFQHHLPGIAVSNMFKDSEGSWWFCTIGKGVYRLNSSVALNMQLSEKTDKFYKVGDTYVTKDIYQAGNTINQIKKYVEQDGTWDDQGAFAWFQHLPLYCAITLKDKSVVLGTSHTLKKLRPGLTKKLAEICPIIVKSMCPYRDNILVATDKCVVVIEAASLKILDTVWRDRATCIYSTNNIIYLGTLNGAYQLNPDKKIVALGERVPVLQGRIAALTSDANGVLWIATNGQGLIGWRNDTIIKTFTRHNGLPSSICRTIFYYNGQLWLGTDKGVTKIDVLQPGFPIQKYTTSDGLSSDIIDAIYVTSNKVFIGTPEGMTFFDEEKMTSHSRCDLRFTDITIGGKSYYPGEVPELVPHAKNNIQFNFVGISYRSGGDISYRYRLLGLDSQWNETRETLLSYPALPSGDYQLQVQATNKFDVSSQVLTAGFTIEKLLYEKNWFRLLIVVTSMALTGLVMWLIIRRIRRREQEKTSFVKRISELEQLSRKAQMNPHFIFNSLNSIQQYVMDADVTGANKFISGFSRLIRQTLDFSSRPDISLEEELDYLGNYLELEKTRLENSFSYRVVVAETVNPSDYYIPPMILQPFVENSVRHGLRFRRDKNGVITIAVKRDRNHLVCIVEDNGIGRKAAMRHKSISPINYQSKGLSLTADRIDMFNREHEQKITMHIEDLEDDVQHALGTRVTIRFPVI